MNEPNQQTAAEWYSGAVPAIKAIRDAGATQTILIPGTGWTGVHSWIGSGKGAAWTGFKGDPLNNFAFEMHQCLDSDSSGTHSTCMTNCSASPEAATSWLTTNGFKGFLDEFGWSTDPSCSNEGPAFMDYLSSHSNAWMGWSSWTGGPWYPWDYMFMLDPIDYIQPILERPQVTVLAAHL